MHVTKDFGNTKNDLKGAYLMKISSDVIFRSQQLSESEIQFYVKLVSLLLIGLIKKPVGKSSYNYNLFIWGCTIILEWGTFVLLENCCTGKRQFTLLNNAMVFIFRHRWNLLLFSFHQNLWKQANYHPSSLGCQNSFKMQ